MNYICMVDFFKSIDLYNEEIFNYLNNHTEIVPNDKIDIIKENEEIKLLLPEMIGIDNILIYIYMYTKALFTEDDEDIYPNLVQAMFLKEYLKIDKITEKCKKETEEEIKNQKTYKIGKIVKLNYLNK